MSTEKLATKTDLQEMYSRILPYLGGSADAGFTPVGTIISVMGTTAPENYLACNGQVVNIADYPELADYFYNQFGSKNKFGGNGTTTFGIPDLRGEFLRGTGTNSHTNQGSGATVGTHQDATAVPAYGMTSDGKLIHQTPADTFYNQNSDYGYNPSVGSANTGRYYQFNGSSWSTTSPVLIGVRPTNTSVLYCIATKNIYINPEYDYSTSEKVIGHWVNGATLYQKTVEISSFPNAAEGLYAHNVANIGIVVDAFGMMQFSNGTAQKVGNGHPTGSNYNIFLAVDKTDIRIFVGVDRRACSGYITIQYTKTS